ncbi:MAG: threonine/serine dehydratase [Chloroflexi bacterium]|nr:threonine/serine dehydratase [Chloroflexota bacterium]
MGLDAEPLVTLAEIREAADRVRGIVVRTPLLPFGQPLAGDPRGRTRVWLKPENLQPIGAFKLRGAYNAIAQLPEAVRARGVVTASSGNHAQGVSRAARLLGIRAVIVMPVDAPRTKVAGVEADGAEIVFVGPASEERAERAAAIADTEGLALIPPYDHRHIIAGQGTCGLEIAEQITELQDAPTEGNTSVFPPGPFTVLVPIGGGGLASGIATAVKAIRPDATVLGVEPELAADARDSLREGRIVRWSADDVARTSADGMRTMSLGRLPFRHLRRWLDGVLVVDEASIAAAMLAAARWTRMVVEPSGATSLAAWLTHGEQLPDGPVVCVVSGGNVDPSRYRALLELAEAAEQPKDGAAARGATGIIGA